MGANQYLKELVIVFLSALVVLFYPVILLIVTVSLTYRYVVQTIVRKDIKEGKILSGLDACLAAFGVYTSTTAILVPFFIFNTRADKYEVMRIFTERILKPKETGGKCVYPEMTQKIVRKYGYNFWVKDDNFNLENHIKYINEGDPDAPMTKREITDFITQKILHTPFYPNRSPWEILVVRNLNDPEIPDGKSALIYKVHHCFFDGYSLISFYQKIAMKPWKELSGTPKLPEMETWKKVLLYLWFLVSGPYHLMKFMLFANDNIHSKEGSSLDLSGHFHFHESKHIPLQTLKNIKNHFKVDMTSVLYTILAEGLRQTFEKRNVALSKFHISTSFFVPGHPDHLTNHWAVVKIPVTVYKEGVEKTLQCVAAEYRKVKHSLSPLTMWYLTKFIGLLPIPFHPNPTGFSKSTLAITNFPGPGHAIDMFGYEQIQFGLGGLPGPGVLFIMSLQSYKGYLRIGVGCDDAVLPDEKDVFEVTKTLENIIRQWAFEVEKQKD